MPTSQGLLTTQQFALKSGASSSTISKWLRSGKLKGEKISGKWMISPDQLAHVTAAAPPTHNEASAAPKTAADQGATHTYSVDEFSALTYLTAFGVERYLKEGRLTGSRDNSGKWRIHATNLEHPHIRRLVRK